MIEFPAVVSDGVAYIGNNHGTVRALSMRNGRVVWRRDVPRGKMAASPAVVGRDLVVHAMDGAVRILDRTTGRLRFAYHVGSPIESSPLVRDRIDYFGAWNGNVYALDLRTRRLRWLYRSGYKITSSAALAGRALDFGCGVGRLTIPLAEHFDEVVGIDIAPGMVEQARSYAAEVGSTNVCFLLNEHEELQLPTDECFDLVFTSQVLQHLPSRRHIARYVCDLVARVAPGGVLIAQVPERIDMAARLQPSRRAYSALRGLGVPRSVLYRRLRLNPMRMRSFSRKSFESLLQAGGLRIESIVERRRPPVLSCTYLGVRPAATN